MNTLLIVGIIIGAGFAFGELVERLGLPRVTGYILAGVLLNPNVIPFVPVEFVQATQPITNVALAVLTFAVGGTLALAPLRELGKGIAFIALGEAELATLLVTIGALVTLPFLLHMEGATLIATYLPFALLLGSLASPTDPSATLAVIHQYRAKGPVAFSIMGVAALDDALGIINFSLAGAAATVLIQHSPLSMASLISPLLSIGGAIALGVILGFFFHFVSGFLRGETEGLLIVLIIAILTSCYGIAALFELDRLLATMCVGITVVNFGRERDKIFRLIEQYAEPLVFVIFFTISGMLLDFRILRDFLPLVLLFAAFQIGRAHV